MRRIPLPAFLESARTRLWLRRVLMAWGGWLVISTVLLNQPLIDNWINRKPVRAQVLWSFALSIVPGHVHAWGVTYRGHSRRQAFAIMARHASVWFVPWALLRKEIRLVGLRASGLAVALREGQVELPPPQPRERPWSVVLADAQAEDVWSVQLGPKLHITGLATAQIDLSKTLSGGAFEIPRSQVDWGSLAMHWDGRRVMSGGRIAGTMTLAPMVPSKMSTMQKIGAVSLDVLVDGALPSLELFEGGLQMAAEKPPAGSLTGRVAMVSGRLEPSTGLKLRQPVHVQAEGIDQTRELTADLNIEADRMLVAIDLPPGKTRATTISARVSLPRLYTSAEAKSDHPDFGTIPNFLAADATGHVDATVRFRSLALLRPLLARMKGLTMEGEGWMQTSLHFEHGRYLADKSSLRFEDATLRMAALGHSVEAEVNGSPDRIEAEGEAPRHRIALQAVVLRGPDGEELLRDADAQLDLVAGKQATALNEAPGLAFHMSEAAIPDLRAINRYLPPGAVSFEGGNAALSLSVELEADQPKAQGSLKLHSRSATVAISDMRLKGAVDIATTLRDADLEQHTLDITGTRVSLHDVDFDAPGGKPVQGWSMVFNVDRAHAKIGTPLEIDGNGRIGMSDLSLLLAIYAHMSDYPAWMLRLVDAGKVEAHGRFQVKGNHLRLDDVHAQNNRFKVDARLQLEGKRKKGALLAQWGPLSMGVGLGGPKAKLHFRKAEQWFTSGQP
ncbi:hypothetical protein [Arenimonas daejeonensis]|uniref:hypothetical protein n=1 Tax=Arenimonas daejeonensis TaxID=370777 RepID=UPI0011BD465F|nr:hypothetical protein [Arenimonas daejeonensis]